MEDEPMHFEQEIKPLFRERDRMRCASPSTARRSARTVGVDSDRQQNKGFMMGWTEADGDALFRQPPDEQAGEDASSGFDGSHEAMRGYGSRSRRIRPMPRSRAGTCRWTMTSTAVRYGGCGRPIGRGKGASVTACTVTRSAL